MTDEFTPISEERETSQEEADFNAEIMPQSVIYEDSGEAKEKRGFSSKAFWQQLRRAFLPTRRERAEHINRRIAHLSNAIEFSPDAPTNYVLRGELYMEMGEYALAIDDFRYALERAKEQTESEDWGIVAQVMQDRALQGLAAAERHTL